MTDRIYHGLDRELRDAAETIQPLYAHHQWIWDAVGGTPTRR